MTTVSTGFLGKAGMAKATVWGTRVAPAANGQILIDRETMTAELEMLEDASFSGLAMNQRHIAGRTMLRGDIGGVWRYGRLDLLVLCAFGTVGAWTVSTTNESYGDFTLVHATSGDQFDAQFISLDIDKGGGLGDNWQRFNSCAINRLEFEYNAGTPLRYSANLIGGGASGYTKGNSAPANLSIASVHEAAQVLGQHVKFFIADTTSTLANETVDTTPMTEAYRFYPGRFRIAVDNGLADFVTGVTEPYNDVPRRDRAVEIAGEFSMPIIETSASYSDAIEFLTDYEARTLKKLVMSCQYTANSIDYCLNFYVPALQLISKSGWDLSTRGRIQPTFGFRCVSHPDGLTPANIWTPTSGFGNLTLAAATLQKLPWVNIQNNATAIP